VGTLLVGTATLAIYDQILRPRILGWGATNEESTTPMPGDDLIPNPLTTTTRAIRINAPVEKVWPWLVQIGQGRGGFYSYDWLENIFGMNIHNTDRILPEYQQLNVGDLVLFWRGVGVTVRETDPPQTLVLGGSFDPNISEVGGTWTFLLHPLDAAITRLIVRARIAEFPPTWFSRIFSFVLLEPVHFIMERGMLFGIKNRVEKNT
jgi:hypothetical protein